MSDQPGATSAPRRTSWIGVVRAWPRTGRWAAYVAVALGLLLVAGLITGTVFVRRPLPQTSGEIDVPGLSAPVGVVRDDRGRVRVSDDIDLLVEAVSVASALGPTSAYTWLKLPAPTDPERMMAATTLPALLLGGDPGDRAAEMIERWRRAMEIPNVRGLVAGRSLIFPTDGEIERWVDDAVAIVHGGRDSGNTS